MTEIGHFLREYVNIHQSLVLLTLFILISNGLVVHATYADTVASSQAVILDPYKVADTVRIISPYMGDINQDADAIAIELEERVTGSFISTNPLIATQPGQSDEPDILTSPAPTDTTDPSRRTADLKYSVEIGDTLGGISSSYGLKIATLRVKNNLSDVDSIKPGQQLIIPPQDLSEKAIAAADARKKPRISSAKIVSNAKSGGYGLAVPIRHHGITRRLVGGHTGIDYRADLGTPVYAADEGVVIVAEKGWNGGFGANILVSHGGGLTTRYAHCSRIAVGPGQTVKQGQLIGYSGNSGRSTGPHLHFELRVNGVARDPGT